MTKTFESNFQRVSRFPDIPSAVRNSIFGNFHSTALNLRYCRFGSYCSWSNSLVPKMQWPLKNAELEVVEKALEPADAQVLSNDISSLVESGEVGPLAGEENQFIVDNIWSRRSEMLSKVFDGPLGQAVRRLYGSEFRVQWIDCYRTYQGERKSSFLWHMDNSPPFHVKGLLYLTDCDHLTGATQFLTPGDADQVKKHGYFGIVSKSRKESISSFNNGKTDIESTVPLNLKAGDAVLFNSNLLHRGGEVLKNHRDVVSFFLLPSRRSWKERSADFLRKRYSSYFKEDLENFAKLSGLDVSGWIDKGAD